VIGEVRSYRGQSYRCEAVEHYRRRDGATIELAVWRSHCTTCRASFTLKTPALSKKFVPSRRCPIHRRPGVRVRQARRAP
jgi:hypothetical protein